MRREVRDMDGSLRWLKWAAELQSLAQAGLWYSRDVYDRERFERYRRRYSPYGSVASICLWAISHMDVPGYSRDYVPMTDAQKKAARKKRSREAAAFRGQGR